LGFKASPRSLMAASDRTRIEAASHRLNDDESTSTSLIAWNSWPTYHDGVRRDGEAKHPAMGYCSTPPLMKLRVKNTCALERLSEACMAGHLTAIHTELQQPGVDINASWRGSSPLHDAVRSRQIQAVSLLLKARANVNQRSTGGITSDSASNGGDHRGLTPLMVAARNNSGVTIVKLLCRARADVTLVDSNTGNNALHWLSYYGESAGERDQTAHILLQQPHAVACIHIQNKDQLHAVAYAASHARPTLTNILFCAAVSDMAYLHLPVRDLVTLLVQYIQ